VLHSGLLGSVVGGIGSSKISMTGGIGGSGGGGGRGARGMIQDCKVFIRHVGKLRAGAGSGIL